jgi:hypothetical protein
VVGVGDDGSTALRCLWSTSSRRRIDGW